MPKFSLMFYKKDCMGCHACEVACKQEHGLGTGPRLVRVIEKSPDFFPVYCRHCSKAPCLEACPSEAIFKTSLGAVLIEGEKCIGCRECLEACPFGAMQFADDMDIAMKCDLCIERIQSDEQPACSLVCPTGCILWGPANTVSERIAAEKIIR